MLRAALQHLQRTIAWEGVTGPIASVGIPGVFAADDLIPDALLTALHDAVMALEAAGPPDWHPGSDEQVRDLVHPSMYPLVKGVSLVLPPEASRLTLSNCLRRMGEGAAITEFPPVDDSMGLDEYDDDANKASDKFQWLPANFSVDSSGKVVFQSYINNLHPITHRALYEALPPVLELFVPLFNQVLTHMATYPTGVGLTLSHSPPDVTRRHVDLRGKDLQVGVEDDACLMKSAMFISLGHPPMAFNCVVAPSLHVKLATIHLTPDNACRSLSSWPPSTSPLTMLAGHCQAPSTSPLTIFAGHCQAGHHPPHP
jgi:Protein of unknown function (DUF4246)